MPVIWPITNDPYGDSLKIKTKIQGKKEQTRLKTTPETSKIGRKNRYFAASSNKTESIEKIEIDEMTIRELGLASGYSFYKVSKETPGI